MSLSPDALWLSVSPALRGFNRPLLKALAQQHLLKEWHYCQTVDEPTCLDAAVLLLHEYLQERDRPMHLVGHGTSGLVGLLYARRFPKQVRSLTLLSVGMHPAIDWQAHYYAQLQFLRCPRDIILAQTVCNLLGYQSHPATQGFMQILDRDLGSSLSPHSLYQRVPIAAGGAEVPLMICASADDVVIDPHLVRGWQPFLKEGDRLLTVPQGRYFFHYFYPQPVCQGITQFWQALKEGSSHPWKEANKLTSMNLAVYDF